MKPMISLLRSLAVAQMPVCSSGKLLRLRTLGIYWIACTVLVLAFNVLLLHVLHIPCIQLLYGRQVEEQRGEMDEDKCGGRYVYVYPLPRAYNEELVERCQRNCSDCVRWRLSDGGLSPPAHSICGRLENGGMGPMALPLPPLLQPPTAWYRTTEGSLELIFHHKMKAYPCLTTNPRRAHAFYIPFYAALDIAFTVFSPQLQVRDRLSQRLLGWLTGNEVWQAFNHKPHFTVVSRVVWDFCREEEKDEWGNSYLMQPELANVTKMMLERRVWDAKDVGVPFPTSFHPSSDEDLTTWQETMKNSERKWLVTFVGSAKRGFNTTRKLRARLMEVCKESEECQLGVKCSGEEGWVSCTERPENVIGAFLSSVFCLQPEGDSATRKSFFDSLIAGCIPVVFTNLSAYHQYVWHLPHNGSLYSVLLDQNDVVDGNIDVISELKRIPFETVKRMQLTIIQLLPTIIYTSPSSNHTFKDAFDIALQSFFTSSPVPIYH